MLSRHKIVAQQEITGLEITRLSVCFLLEDFCTGDYSKDFFLLLGN